MGIIKKKCCAVIKSKKSKLYNCQCPHPAKKGGFCGLHKKNLKGIEITPKGLFAVDSFIKGTIIKHLKFSELSIFLTKKLGSSTKKKHGIYFTSSLLVNLILIKLKLILPKLNLLISKVIEPSCGSGEFLDGLNNHFYNLNILGVEYNPIIYNKIKNFLLSNNHLAVKNQDFLTFFDTNGFDLVIGNPPFKSIKKSLVVNYNSFFPNKVNLYVLFLLHGLQQLKNNGVLVFILPKSFLNSLSYNTVRVHIKDNYKILYILDDLGGKCCLGTKTEVCVLFLQKKKSISKFFLVFFGEYLSFSSHYRYLNRLLSEGNSLISLGFTITVGNVLKSDKKHFSCGLKGHFICDSSIHNNKLVLDPMLRIRSNSLVFEQCIIVFRGYGNIKFSFKYALVEIGDGYLIENHLLIIKQIGNVTLHELIRRFEKKKTLDFIELYFSNQSLNVKELELLPIF